MAMILVALPVYFMLASTTLEFIMRGYTGDDFWRRVGLGVAAALLLNAIVVIAGLVFVTEFAGDSVLDGVVVAVERALPPLIVSHWVGVALYFGLVWRWTQSTDRSAVRTDLNGLLWAGEQPRKRKTQDEAATPADAPAAIALPAVKTVLLRYLGYTCAGIGAVTGLMLANFTIEPGSAYVATLIFATLFSGLMMGTVAFLTLAFTLPSLRLAMRGYTGDNNRATLTRLVIYAVVVDAGLLFIFSLFSGSRTLLVTGTLLGLTALVHNGAVAMYYLQVRQWARQREPAT
ncbi:MAG: hypothetical protein AAFU54_11035 [Chloroflexota bacterium]